MQDRENYSNNSENKYEEPKQPNEVYKPSSTGKINPKRIKELTKEHLEQNKLDQEKIEALRKQLGVELIARPTSKQELLNEERLPEALTEFGNDFRARFEEFLTICRTTNTKVFDGSRDISFNGKKIHDLQDFFNAVATYEKGQKHTAVMASKEAAAQQEAVSKALGSWDNKLVFKTADSLQQYLMGEGRQLEPINLDLLKEDDITTAEAEAAEEYLKAHRSTLGQIRAKLLTDLRQEEAEAKRISAELKSLWKMMEEKTFTPDNQLTFNGQQVHSFSEMYDALLTYVGGQKFNTIPYARNRFTNKLSDSLLNEIGTTTDTHQEINIDQTNFLQIAESIKSEDIPKISQETGNLMADVEKNADAIEKNLTQLETAEATIDAYLNILYEELPHLKNRKPEDDKATPLIQTPPNKVVSKEDLTVTQ